MLKTTLFFEINPHLNNPKKFIFNRKQNVVNFSSLSGGSTPGTGQEIPSFTGHPEPPPKKSGGSCGGFLITGVLLILLFLCLVVCCFGLLALSSSTDNPLLKFTPQPSPTPTPMVYDYTHTYEFINEGPDDIFNLQYQEAIPPDLPGQQEVLSWQADPSDIEIQSNLAGWKTARFNLGTLKSGFSIKVTITSRVLLHYIHFDLGTCQGDMIDTFTVPEKYIESDSPAIHDLADELSEGKTTPCEKARAFYDYVASKLTYKMTEDEGGALHTMETLTGDCTDYSDLLIALNRSAGIPARRVHGYTYYAGSDDGEANTNPLNITHQWLEVYLPGSGWVPMDPTWGKGENPSDIYFAGLSPTHITLTHSEKPGESGMMHYRYEYKYYSKPPGPKVTINDDIQMVKALTQ